MIETLAGSGEPGFVGDGGSARLACLNEPKNVALDCRGGLFIADSENHVIRKMDLATGLICTVAGCPPSGGQPVSPKPQSGARQEPDPLEEDPFAESVPTSRARYTQQRDLSGMVRFVVGSGPSETRFHGDGGPALDATLNFPSAIVVDHRGNLYIADTMNHRVRKVDADTRTITTVAGTGQHRWSGDNGAATEAALNEPAALALDERGGRAVLYIADQSNNRVRRMDLETGIMTTVAGTGESAYAGDGGPAVEACLAGPSGLAVGPDGSLYIADTFNGRIRLVEPDTGRILTVVGDGTEYRYHGQPHEFSTSLSRPYGIALDPEGDLLITDSDSHLIRRWDRRRKIITRVTGSGEARFAGDGGPCEAGSLNYPFGVAVDRSGTIYIADTFNHRIRVIGS